MDLATRLENLEKRLAMVEGEVASLRALLERRYLEETPVERGARLLREAKANQAALSAGIAKAFAEMGISGEPIGAEKVQEMIAACGFKPEDKEFSRGIIEMREE
jgi:hypothetical protein